MSGTALLACTGVSKRFGGAIALDNVDVTLHKGRVLALIGENGAGKSTLISVLTGAARPDEGVITTSSGTCSHLSPAAALALGIVAIRQEPVLVPTLSIEENLILGIEPSVAGLVRRRQRRAQATQWLDEVAADLDPRTKVGELRPADRQLVEIARAVGTGAQVLFFDEPTACLSPVEVARLFTIVRSLSARGAAVAYVSHRLDEILELTDEVVVLRDGRRVASGPTSEFDTHGLASAMAGRDVDTPIARVSAQRSDAPPALLLTDVSSGRLRSVSLDVRPGEIHGIAGIVGSSRSRLASVVAGVTRMDTGRMTLDGEIYAPRSPREAISRGVAFVPEDRWRDSLFGDASQATNVVFPRLPATAGFLTTRAEVAQATETLEELDVRPRQPRMTARQLSGGNQQKLVLGRALGLKPRVLILDEPTRGVDVSAKQDIHQAIQRAAAAGTGVLVISSDLPELIALSDRITVLERGRAAATFLPPYDPTELMAAAVGTELEAS
jgi:ABC-type sugar transport system ATPase subunit